MSTKKQPAPSQKNIPSKKLSKKAALKPSPLKLSPKPPKVEEAKPTRATYSEKWSLHPGEALRLKRGISAKDQQARAKHPVVTPQDVFESPKLRAKAFHADKDCLIFCGDVREVLGWLAEAGVYADCVVTSPPFCGQRDYGVAGQIGLEQTPYEFITKLVDVFSDVREILQTSGSVWVNLGDTYWNGRGVNRVSEK